MRKSARCEWFLASAALICSKSRPAAEITQGTGKTPAKEYPAHDDRLSAPKTGDVEVVEAPLRRFSLES